MERAHASTVDEHVDVAVVGARVAGAATALQLARAGRTVAVLDRVRLPADTLSTHAIARSGMVQLAKLGLVDELHRRGTPEVRDISFHSERGIVRRRLKERAGIDHLLAPRRHVLDPVLLDAAEAAGASVRTGAKVVDLLRDAGGRVAGVVAQQDHGDGRRPTTVRVHARHVVGADGRCSTVARLAGAPVLRDAPSPGATHYRYVAGLDAAGFEYHLAGGSMAGVFTTNDDQACVWVCCPAEAAAELRAQGAGADRIGAFDELVGRGAPELAERLRRTEAASPVRGAVGLPNRVVGGAGPGWWLVGDAAYHRDPVTGHGISDALRDAEVVAGSIAGHLAGEWDERWARARYELRRHRAINPMLEVTCRMAHFPPLEEMIALQKRVGELVDAESHRLATVGGPGELLGATG